ncbi:hypothetical protein GCM10007304_35250 [Rhodococcoides trifolii]|uniref:Lipase n=1 Tax=Rhodococcoides trifolii TaxID=908250 RepID=A0A917LFH5_9NOCA|nr:lipase [Rhodococcus trifolii]GGG18185.1 hypothetical protein GCM10007304_35250 [Rhodococcus trifolii]
MRVLLMVVLLMFASAGVASAGGMTGGAPVQSPGPALTVDRIQLRHALTCTPDLAHAKKDPVLLTPAFATDTQSFGWNYSRSLPAQGFPVCSLSIPGGGFDDLQIAAQYVVSAVRTMHEASGRKVVLMGHQHGPLDEMWALKFWPDLPALVSDFVSLATPYNGTQSARTGCDSSKKCGPANWQIATGSAFLAALNSRPLPAGPSYTSIYTMFDELIYPQPTASTIGGVGASIAVQDVCAYRPVEHFGILSDNVTYLLVMDALTHDGPADPARIPKKSCLTVAAPGLDPIGSALSGPATATSAVINTVQQAVAAEPPVAEYAR